MTKDDSLRDGLEHFYGDILEDYKAAQRMVMSESTIGNMFKKANYGARIADFARVKKAIIGLDIKKPKDISDLENDLIDALNLCKELLKTHCDTLITMQQALKAKADGERKVGMLEYKKIMNEVRGSLARLNKGLHNLDIFYSDWLEED